MPFKSKKQRKWMHANEPEMAKKWEKKKVKKETKVAQLIRKMVREIMAEKKGLWHNIHAKRKRGEKPAKPGDKDYPKTLDIDENDAVEKEREKQRADKEKMRDRQYRDMERARERQKRLDKMKKEGFAGGLKKEDQKEFEKNRKESAEVLGYTLTGKSDLKTEIDKLTEEIEEIKRLHEGGAQIAKTILQQLGGNRFIAMTGAKNLGHTNKGLQMKIGRNAKSITHVIINLKSSDLYEMEFIRMRGAKRTVVKKVSGVYNDQLGTMFKKYTGMNVRL